MRRALVFAFVPIVGCTDVVPPERPAPYQFAIDCSSDGRCGGDAPEVLSFKWPARALPVRIWVEGSATLRDAVRGAVQLWAEAGLYGEFRGAFVSDSTFADILFLQTPATGVPRVEDNPALDCAGSTTLGVALDTTIVLPFRTAIAPRLGARQDEIRRCFRIVAAHELGHSLGLLIESTDPDDLMYAQPTVESLSLRDRATFTTLYHSAPTVRLPGER